ncbi:MAG: hypothetical protein KF819_18385 [Labilithrix sp.]|nr:hypothetical protein [Labilithrix sp.]
MRREDLPIEAPCGQDWDGMKPADMKKRFCDACTLHVHDLAAMTKREAKALLSSEETEGLCVRYLYDRHGEIVFSDDPRLIAPSRLLRAKRFAAAAVALAFPMTLTACMGAAPARPMPKAPPAATSAAPAPTAPVAK